MGCASAVQSALATVPEFKDLDTKPADGGGTATVMVAKDFDYASKLDEIAKGTHEVEGWKEMN